MHAISPSRRGLLMGRVARGASAPRPPWALPAGPFEDACTRCGECVRACPAALLAAGDGGFPTVDFARGACTFCGDCAAVCRAGALDRGDGDAPPWRLAAVIGAGCLARQGVECRVCGEACGVAAIAFRPTAGGVAQPRFDAARCSGCGACCAPCPVGAIAMTNDMEQRQ